MFEIIFAAMKGFDFGGVVVETDHVETGAVEGGEEGETDVAEADDADAGGFGGDFVKKGHFWVECIRKNGLCPGAKDGRVLIMDQSGTNPFIVSIFLPNKVPGSNP